MKIPSSRRFASKVVSSGVVACAALATALMLQSCGSSAPVAFNPTAIAANVAKSCPSADYPWKGQGSQVFRDAAVDQGEWIYSNGLWQAQGANSDMLHRTEYYAPAPVDDPGYVKRDLYLAMTYDFFGSHRAAHNGDYQLPLDKTTWPDGTADLAELRLAVRDGALYVRFLWNSMPSANAQIATLTFSHGAAPVAPWPRGAALSSGWQKALTLWGNAATVQSVGGDEVAVPASAGDHVTEACIPLSLLPPAPWTLTGGSGLNDPAADGQYWNVPMGDATDTVPGSGSAVSPTNVWDLLFATDTPWTFDERSQADELAVGTVLKAKITLDPATLANNATVAAPVRTGDLSRLLISGLSTADGITRDRQGIAPVGPPAGYQPPIPTPDFNVSYYYTGRLQTYSMHVPASYATSTDAYPLIVYLHGYTGLPEEPFYNPVGLIDMADANGYIVASALGRGDYFYRGEGDDDVLEVIADVEKRYRIDPDRIYLMGHSMGGYGTNNVGMRHPDLFAAIAPAEGTDSAELYGNLRHVPWFMMTADEDLDTGAQNALALYDALSAAGYDATVLEYRTKIHEYSSIYDTLPRLFNFFAAHVRDPNPAVVTYTRLPGDARPDLGLTYDGAYWLSGLQAADDTLAVTATVESGGIAHGDLDPTNSTRTDAAVDEGGPTGRTAAQLKQTIPAYTATKPLSNSLAVTASNATALAIDLSRAAVSPDTAALTVSSNNDRAYVLSLSGASAAQAQLSIDGAAPTTVTQSNGAFALALPAGAHSAVLTVP